MWLEIEYGPPGNTMTLTMPAATPDDYQRVITGMTSNPPDGIEVTCVWPGREARATNLVARYVRSVIRHQDDGAIDAWVTHPGIAWSAGLPAPMRVVPGQEYTAAAYVATTSLADEALAALRVIADSLGVVAPAWTADKIPQVAEAILFAIRNRSPEGMVRRLHEVMGLHGGLMPAMPNARIPYDVAAARMGMLLEEVTELAAASEADDIVGIADALADCVVVLIGTAVVHGIPFDRVLREVCRSNMTKTNNPDEPKLIKGPGYSPPQIAPILAEVQPPW